MFASLVAAQSPTAQPLPRKPPPKPGVKTPGVQQPLSRLQPDATVQIGGSPDWIAIGDDVWVSNNPKGIVTRIDPRTNKTSQTLTGFSKPCAGLAIGFGSLWVPNCGAKNVARVDLKSGKITSTIATTIADSEGGIATGAGSVWVVADAKSTLVRIDPEQNKIVGHISLPEGCYTPAFAFDSVWVACTKQDTVVRVDPTINKILTAIKVGPQPRFLSAGEGAVWTLNQSDGTVSRIEPSTNKVIATIEVGIPGEGGDISAEEGSVWATSFGVPLSRIDPKTNRVVQQFVGEGGDAIRAGRGMVWLSNYKSGIEWRLDPKKIEAIPSK